MISTRIASLTTLALAAGLVLATPATAQEAPRVYVGARAGIASSSWSGVSGGEQNRREGFVGGAYLNHSLGEYFYFQVEAQYAQRGTELSSGTFALDYFELPLLLGVRLDAGIFTPRVYAGLSTAFQVGCDDGGAACGDEWNRVDFGIPFGGALDVALGRTRLQLDLRITLGLTDLNGDAPGSFKSRTGSATLGVAFPIG